MPRLKLLHGFHAITARLRAFPATVNEVWYDPARQDARMRAFLHLAASANARLIAADASRLNALSGEKRHQGVVARVTEATRAHSLETLLDTIEGQPLLLVLDCVTDPHNLGACLRVADGAGAHAVIAPRRRAAGLSAAAAEAASGAAETVPYLTVINLARALRALKNAGIQVIGTADDATTSLFDIQLDGALALVMGAEGAGMRRLTREACDEVVRIPLAGHVQSLNVSVASGICLFEAVRQRLKGFNQWINTRLNNAPRWRAPIMYRRMRRKAHCLGWAPARPSIY